MSGSSGEFQQQREKEQSKAVYIETRSLSLSQGNFHVIS
jgi:hypothetical protein